MNLVGVVGRVRLQLYAVGCAGLLAGAGLFGCNLDNPGVTTPRGVVNYPIALALSAPGPEGASNYLFVANANTDLRFNSGSVQAYDLAALAERLNRDTCRGPQVTAPAQDAGAGDAEVEAGLDAEVADAEVADADVDDAETGDGAAQDGGVDEAGALDAGDDGADGGLPTLPRVQLDGGAAPTVTRTPRATLCDGRATSPDDESVCCFSTPEALDPLRVGEVFIDSFASSIAVHPSGDTLYVPVRSQTRLLYISVNDGELSCGGGSRCERGPLFDAPARAGELKFPGQPTAAVTGTLSDVLLPRSGTAQVDTSTPFVATTHDSGLISLFTIDGNGYPVLQHVLGGGLTRAVSLSKDPVSRLFYVSSAASTAIDRLGVRVQGAGSEPELRLERTSSVPLTGVSQAIDVRYVLADSRDAGQGQPRRLYALVRGGSPSSGNSLLFLQAPERTPEGSAMTVVEQVLLGEGLNRLLQADIGGRHLLFASGFSERAISVVDADTRQLVETIGEFSGPYDMQIDVPRQLLYVADFAASVVRVVDLRAFVDPSLPRPHIVATLGRPYFTGSIQ